MSKVIIISSEVAKNVERGGYETEFVNLEWVKQV